MTPDPDGEASGEYDPRFPYAHLTNQSADDASLSPSPGPTPQQPSLLGMPTPGGQLGPEKGTALKVWVGAGISIIIMLLFWLFLNQLGEKRSVAEESPSYVSHQTLSSSAATIETEGWQLRVGGLDLHAEQVLGNSLLFGTVPADQKIVAVPLQFTNVGTETAEPYYDFTFVLRDDDDGLEYQEENMLDTDRILIALGNISPGHSEETLVAFAVPQSFNSGELQVQFWEDLTLMITSIPVP